MLVTVAAINAETAKPTLDAVKAMRRYEGDDSQDEAMGLLRMAAIHRAEAETNRLMQRRQVIQSFDYGFPACLRLRWKSVASVTSVKYVDDAGVEQTLAADQYQLTAPFGETPCEVVPAYNVTWPSTRWQRDAVTVTYQAGDDPDETLQTAIHLLIGAWDDNREDMQPTFMKAMPAGSSNIFRSYKI